MPLLTSPRRLIQSKMATVTQSNHETIEGFYRNSEKLRRYILSRINNEDDAEDLMQDIILRMLEYKSDIYSESADSLAFAIASHVVNDFLRHKYVRTAVHSQIAVMQTGVTNETENTIVGRDMERLVRRHIKAMPPQRRLIYILRMHEGKTTKEIAESLNISTRTAENHYYIGIRQMRKCVSAAI